jgi:hypothetical protein
MKVFNSHADFCAWAKTEFAWALPNQANDDCEAIYLIPDNRVVLANRGATSFEEHHTSSSRTIYRRTGRLYYGMPVFQ